MDLRRGYAGILAGLLLAMLVPGAAQAGAEVTCDHNPLTNRVTVTINEGYARVRRNGPTIQYTGWGVNGYRPCETATVNNTDKIVLVDNSQGLDRYFGIDQSRGRFEPGKTSESQGRSEIEFEADYSGTDYESMFVATGTDRDDRMIAGSNGLKLNRDDDLDVQLSDVGFVSLEGLGGDDTVTLTGGEGTGAPIGPTEFFENSLTGGQGDDKLFGGPGLNSISGGEGADVLRGASGIDSLLGNDGHDRIFGGPGDESYVLGGSGNDHLEGSRGDDWLRGNAGNDHLDGDAGTDQCEGGTGEDTLEDCES